MITRINIFIGVILVLLVILIIQGIQQGIENRRNEKKIDEIYQVQMISLEHIKRKNQAVLDSLEVLVLNKNKEIKSLEESLYQNVEHIHKNNIKYEKLKKNALHITDTDSLANSLTKRY
ncbi:hypothetical protein [Aquimarina algiphila]|uniref:Uncharacterized protein n=1 Tax=Aquimarina algiphila TaxID=2047982 RepID=A0A554VEX7_9FLAO|nr:hypothetical protein [Aquimarina algiphila]TSE05674.1 hypothetical protein FOF46_21845 [Aquimarina algiphila]